jgi:hypothetical protein
VTLPTNLELDESVRTRFPEFFAALFDQTMEKNPRAVVTEYAWSVSSCDPCPGPTLSSTELDVLGGDVLPRRGMAGQYVLTRLHTRYSKDTLGEDLVFAEAPPIEGGRDDGSGRTGAVPAQLDNFQGRYIVRHPWKAPITCASPQRGIWGGPPYGDRPVLPPNTRDPAVERGKLDLGGALRTDAAAIGVQHRAPPLEGSDAADDSARGRFRAGMSYGLLFGAALAMVVTARSRRRER